LKCSIFHELFGFLLNLSIQNYMNAEPVGCKDIGCNETGFKNEVDEPNKLNKILCTKKVLFLGIQRRSQCGQCVTSHMKDAAFREKKIDKIR